MRCMKFSLGSSASGIQPTTAVSPVAASKVHNAVIGHRDHQHHSASKNDTAAQMSGCVKREKIFER